MGILIKMKIEDKFLPRREFLKKVILFSPLLIFSCGKKDSIVSPNEKSSLSAEIKKIESAYNSWSNRLIAQNYQGALFYCVPGGNAYNNTKIHKQMWDSGGQSYYRITSVEGLLDEELLSNNEGEARGNLNYYQYHPSQGEVEFQLGFYSGVVKIDGQWKIDGINSNLKQNWWKK